MALNTLSPLDPEISREIRVFDPSRLEEVERRHRLLAEYLNLKGFDALLIQSPAMFAWFSGGASNQRGQATAFAAILLTAEARVILTSQVDSPQLFDRELNGLGFHLKERPWTEAPLTLRDDCVRGRKIASDLCYPGTTCLAEDLIDFRLSLIERERDLLRDLGRKVAHAVEATARGLQQGETEFEVAGQLMHRLYRHGVTPVQVQVQADGQGHRYRNWTAGPDRIERQCVLAAVGRMQGLHAAASRTIVFGSATSETQDTFDVATLLQTTGMHFSQAGWSVEETWKRVARIYEKFGVADEWRAAEQAEFIGYAPQEERLLPTLKRSLPSWSAIHWHPSVRAALVSDTILVQPDRAEVVTPHENWPSVCVRVRGVPYDRPAILVREIG